MASRAKTERNLELVNRRETDPMRWSFSALGDFYRISKITAYQIYRREKARMNR